MNLPSRKPGWDVKKDTAKSSQAQSGYLLIFLGGIAIRHKRLKFANADEIAF